MSYRITFYCPDRHIEYNLHTLDQTGVGGGITARIRVAHALAKMGHEVVLYVNCPLNETIQSVQYRHYSRFDGADGDILIVSTSGGEMDLGKLIDVTNLVRMKMLMVHGVIPPYNMNPRDYEFIYTPSNFIRKTVVEKWRIRPTKIFVSYHGVPEDNYFCTNTSDRDPYSLVYIGHPSKGLNAAISILSLLRRNDSRWSLHVCGGNQLWGEAAQSISAEPGLVDHGLIGQQHLARLISGMGYCLSLQSISDAFGLGISEAMRGGCVVMASPVGAYPEIIQDGYNGFLMPGNPMNPKTHERAAEIILELNRNPEYLEYVRRNAINSPLSWETVARAWEGHWDWHFKHSTQDEIASTFHKGCSLCNGKMLMLADGLHCVKCGFFQRSFI